VLALLVFALGQLAIEGVTGHPTRVSHDESSGFRGGSIERPPGLGLINEARRRIGMVNTQPCLETVQIMLRKEKRKSNCLVSWTLRISQFHDCRTMNPCQTLAMFDESRPVRSDSYSGLKPTATWRLAIVPIVRQSVVSGRVVGGLLG
jgi:hypothetical protein